MAVMTQEEAYLALHRDYENAMADREKLVEVLRAFAKAGERETGLHRGKAWKLLRELGEEK